jgi:hypothetical protein
MPEPYPSVLRRRDLFNYGLSANAEFLAALGRVIVLPFSVPLGIAVKKPIIFGIMVERNLATPAVVVA